MIQDRIIKYIEFKGLTKYKFYKETSLSNGFLDKKGSIGVDKCEIIYSKYPDINLEWLITGNGEMIKRNDSNNFKSSLKSKELNVSSNNVEVLNMIIESQKETIESQKTTINCCKIAIEILFDKNNPDKVNFESDIKSVFIENILDQVKKEINQK